MISQSTSRCIFILKNFNLQNQTNQMKLKMTAGANEVRHLPLDLFM